MNKILSLFLLFSMDALSLLSAQDCSMDFSGLGCNQIYDLTGVHQFSKLRYIEKLNTEDSIHFIIPAGFDSIIHHESDDVTYLNHFTKRLKFAKLFRKADAIYRYSPPKQLYSFYIFENGKDCKRKSYRWFKVNNQTNELILLDILEKDKSGFVHEQQERVQLKFEGEYLIVFYFTRTVAKFNGEDKPLSTIAICFETKINTMSRRPVETTLCCFPEQNPYAIERLTTHPLGVLILEKYTYP